MYLFAHFSYQAINCECYACSKEHDTDEESVDSDFPPFYGKQDEPRSSSSGDECIVVENPVMESKVSKLLHRICTWGAVARGCYQYKPKK